VGFSIFASVARLVMASKTLSTGGSGLIVFRDLRTVPARDGAWCLARTSIEKIAGRSLTSYAVVLGAFFSTVVNRRIQSDGRRGCRSRDVCGKNWLLNGALGGARHEMRKSLRCRSGGFA
jgi:hypothetical protein